MGDGVLYFPMIRPPANAWFSRVLLYWDRVGTIMPEFYSRDDAFIGPYATELLRENLLTIVPPDRSVWNAGARNYGAAFLELVDRDPFGVNDSASHEWVRLHTDKTGNELATQLACRELARDFSGEEYAGWFDVEKHTADLLMAFLASILGKDPDVAMDPITDSERAIRAFTTLPDNARQIAGEVEPIRYALLTSILPSPSVEVDVPKIAEFKAAHRELLGSFRRHVEREVFACAQIPDTRFREERLTQARTSLAAERGEVEARMGEWKLGPVIRGAIGVAAAALTVTDAILTGGSQLLLAGSALGLASATDSAFNGARRSDVLKQPLAYAALAQREFAPAAPV